MDRKDDAQAEVDLDGLLDQYIKAAHQELALADAAAAAERRQLRAAFEAGTPLTAKVQVDLYDPIDQEVIQIPPGTVITVAEHQGDVLIGTLSDNSHSLAVEYEPPDRWTPRKHFLPLATLVDRTLIEQGAPPSAQGEGGAIKGAALKGADAGTAAAIQSIEALAARDAFAILPRGSRILVQGAQIRLDAGGGGPEGEVWVEVTSAVGDVRSTTDPDELPAIPVRLPDGDLGTVPYRTLETLSFKTQVLTPALYARRTAEGRARRAFLRKLGGVGLAAGFLALDGAWWAKADASWPPEAPPAEQVLSAVTPQLAVVLAYLSAGGKYWFELDGPLYSLKAAGALAATRRLQAALEVIAVASDHATEAWRAAFHRRVHVGWSETRHYKTDKDGKRTYTHSTWSKDYRTIWCEPPGMEGTWQILEGWDGPDDHRGRRGRRLVGEPIFQLLECAPGEAESQFRMMRRDVGFAKDAALSALSAALCTAPPAFYNDLIGAVSGKAKGALAPRQGKLPGQKPALLAVGAVAGAVVAARRQRRLDAELGQNKGALGGLLEDQLREVPTLSFEAAWRIFFGDPSPDALVDSVARRGGESAELAARAHSFTYVYGGGFDHGRRLDPIYIDAGPAKARLSALTTRWPEAARGLAAAVADPAPLVPALRNAVGTDRLNAQIKEDAGEAQTGGWRRSLSFSAPIWGAALLDGILKAI